MSSNFLSLGIPIREMYHNSYLGRFQNWVGHFLEEKESEATRGFTRTFIDFLERDDHVKEMEKVFSNLAAPIQFTPDEILYDFYRNITANVFQKLTRLDSTDLRKNSAFRLRKTAWNAFVCRMGRGRLPLCDRQDFSEILQPELPPPIFDDKGKQINIYVFGFAVGCILRGGCIAGTGNINSEEFDGEYILDKTVGLVNGFPVYSKQVFFPNYQSVRILYMWFGKTYFSSPSVYPNAYSQITITPTDPSYAATRRGTRPPFAFSKVCDEKDYPKRCVSEWMLARLSRSICNGMPTAYGCFFSSRISIAFDWGLQPRTP
eukprot:GHVP01030437.1.p1 GENE.GHVP01030437.1~~GHVP01030437.1.p1  ORF type:complete len:318 (-),score=31.53 GHVP01030437.1:85-1038(-)